MYNNGVSVIIPCYNREKTIKECIQSVLSQDYSGKIEIVISDDGSTDQSIHIIEEFGDQIVLIRKQLNCKDQGVSAARNRGILASSNAFVCFLDSDDYYLPGYIRKMAETLELNPDLGYVFCRCKQEVFLEDFSTKIEDWTRPKLSTLDKKYHALYRGNNIHTNCIFVRRSVLDDVGFFDTSLSNGEDGDMWIRISELSKGCFLDFFGSVYRINHSKDQLTANSQIIIRECLINVLSNAIQRFLASEEKDKLRLLLIVRLLLYMELSTKVGLIYTIHRFTVVNVRLLRLFPKTYWGFLFRM